MELGTFAWLLRRSVVAASDDNCFSIAKGAAYSALLSFFPVLTSAATILVQTRAEYVSDLLERTLSEIVPPGSESLVVQQFRVVGARPVTVLVIAGLISLWAASSVVKSLIEGFQAAYRVPRNRAFLSNSSVAIALVIASAVPLLIASLLVLFGGTVDRMVLNWMKVDPLLNPFAWVWEFISRMGSYLVAFATTVLVTILLYYFGPNRKQQWRYVWPGAILATALWMAATAGFGWYVRHIGRYNVMYGSNGAGIALLVWMYLMSAIALIGCEFNAEYERTQSEPRPLGSGPF
ncbi:MAG: YihY/virulence factor BrkB family protein [Acidobacteriia bacterium]|nr:YihY/virulence factor BrkB family protein [Terriglobia bacterium]